MKPEIRALMDAEGITYSGAYKRVHRDKAREYWRRDNANRTQAKQDAWRGVCRECGGKTSRRDVSRCAPCARIPSDGFDKTPGNQIAPASAGTDRERGNQEDRS